MKWLTAAMVAAVSFGCGGPGIKDPGSPSAEPPPVVGPAPCTADCSVPDPVKSFWPLEAGKVWRYLITDVDKPQFEKTVTVIGKQAVAGFDQELTLVKSVQPYLNMEERSYQLEDGTGLVWRMLEEDFIDGAQVRRTTWLQQGAGALVGTVKSLSLKPEAANWSHIVAITERIEYFDGAPADEKDKNFTWTVIGTESVTVPAGTFEALHVRRERTDKSEIKVRDYWLVPGVGKVKETGERTEELLEYR